MPEKELWLTHSVDEEKRVFFCGCQRQVRRIKDEGKKELRASELKYSWLPLTVVNSIVSNFLFFSLWLTFNVWNFARKKRDRWKRERKKCTRRKHGNNFLLPAAFIIRLLFEALTFHYHPIQPRKLVSTWLSQSTIIWR
jgi:hypothetical protein